VPRHESGSMTVGSATAVLLTAWLLVVVELVNGLPPTRTPEPGLADAELVE
jgi:hypothetical protein